MKSAYFLLILFSSQFIKTCTTAPIKNAKDSSYEKKENLSYGPDKAHTLDLYFPKKVKSNTPMVVMVHGGAWFFGEKETLQPVQEFLAKHNIPSANINYRLNRGDITYKEQLKDIDLALKFIKEQTDSLYCSSQFILFGESAGAHLSLLYGYQNPKSIEKIISLAAPTDFFSKNYIENKIYHWYTKFFFELAAGEKYSGKDTIPQVFKEASPINHASNVPTLILQGTNDIVVDVTQALSLDSVLTKKNVPHKLVLMKGGIHVSRRLPWWRDKVIYPEMLSFLENDYNTTEQVLVSAI